MLIEHHRDDSPATAVRYESPPFLTKVIPPFLTEAGTLRRPRLLDFLHERLPQRATAVVAPAGYGKTTLLAQFSHEVDALACWCTLDEADRDPHTLLTYLVAAVARRVPNFGTRVRAAVDTIGGADARQQLRHAVGLLITELQEAPPDYLLLVVDDCHTLAGSPDSSFVLDLLLEHLPSHCHLILAGRRLPDLPALPRLFAHRQASRLEEPTLRLTREEAGNLLLTAGLAELPPAQLDALYAQSNGWPAALLLLAAQATGEGIDAAQGADGASRSFSPSLVGAHETRETLFDYLAAEVLAQLPSEQQALLRDASVLPYVEPERCAAVVGRPAAEVRQMLQSALAQGLFVTRHEHSHYRFHDLWRDFLLATLREQQPVRYRWLQRRAAGLAEAADDHQAAIAHALAGRHWTLASRLIQAAAPACVASGRWHTLRTWLAGLPAAVLDARPRLLLLVARTEHALAGDHERAEAALRRAEVGLVQHPYGPAEVQLLRAALLDRRGLYRQAVTLCREALARLDGNAPPQLHALGYLQLGLTVRRLGDLPEARCLFEAAAGAYAALADATHEAVALGNLGTVNLHLGRLERAVGELQAACSIWRRLNNLPALARTLNNLGLARHYLGEYAAAWELFVEAARLAREADLPRIEACTWLSLGDVARDCDVFAAAQEAYERGLRLATENQDRYLSRYATDALGQLYRLRGQLDLAEARARQAVHEAKESGSRYEQGLCLRSLALVHLARREHAAALEALDGALAALAASDARREVARVRLYRAQVALAARRRKDALAELALLAALLADLGYHGFLLADARRAQPVLEYGVAMGVGGTRLPALLAAAAASASAQAGAVAPASSVQEAGEGVAGGPGAAGLPALKAFGLGQSHVQVNGRTVSDLEWRRAKSRELFFYLLCRPGWQRRERIVADVWGDAFPAAARSGFHTNAHRLRRVLHPEILQEQHGRYRLHPELRCSFDAVEFDRRCREVCEAADVGEAALRAHEALTLYRGPFLDDLSPEWAQPERERLEALYLAALIHLARYQACQGDGDAALRLARQALAVDPYLEPAHELVMRCQAAAERSAAALHHYRRYADQLRRELDEEPPTELAALYRRILRGEPVPVAFATAAPLSPAPARNGRLMTSTAV